MKAKLSSALVILLISASCASTPSSPSPAATVASVPNTTPVVPVKAAPAKVVPTSPSAPDWTKKTTFVEGNSLVFVVNGLETANVADLAWASMSDYLDIPERASFTVANQAVQDYLKSISSTIPLDKYLQAGRGWWKVSVSKDAWERARTDLLSNYDLPIDPSVDLERAADTLLKQGRYVDAVTAYVKAAAATSSAATPAGRFRVVLDKAQDLLNQFTLSSTTPSQTTQVGIPFSSTFDVKLAFGTGPLAPAVSGAGLRFSYKAKVNGRVAMTGTSVTTNSEGVAQFTLPTMDFASRDSVVVLVDVNPWMEALVNAPKDQRDSVSGFETITATRKIQLPYAVESGAKLVPLIVALADFDEKGSVRARQETTASLIAALQKAGFQTSTVPVNPTLLKSPSESVILAAWKFQHKTVGRAVYGTVNLVSVTASGSQFAAEVAGTLKVVDLTTNALVYQIKSSKIVTAADKATATTQAYRQWATESADLLSAELP